MAYSQEISRQNKALFIFLLDQSVSMEEPLAGGDTTKIDELTLAINAWLQNMVIACSKAVGFKDYFDICILGYGTDENSNPIIGSAFAGTLAGREMVSIKDIAENPARTDKVTQLIPGELGEMLPIEKEMPVWIDATTHGGTPICKAIVKACEIIDAWIPQHNSSFPPIVIHITDGQSGDGDPIPCADALKQRCTKDGNVLFFNCCLSTTAADPFLFRGNSELMPDEFARQLFQMSSVLPESLVAKGRAMGQDLEPNARGMVFNADMVSLIEFLDMGTRTPTLR